jgi:ubiquinone/menaquinone biosynthesis C-methylase UbiE
VQYLDAVSSLDAVQEYKRKTFGLLGAQEGHRVLDIGCGNGDDVQAIAKIVGHDGEAVGIDQSEAMISEAGKRFEDSGLPLKFQVGDAHDLDFANDSFDS